VADSAHDLAAICSAFRIGVATVDTLRGALDTTTLFAVRHTKPRVMACELSGQGRWMVAFTSLPYLARFATSSASGDGGPVEWLSSNGADLISLLPADVGLLIDPGQEYAVALPPTWLRPEPENNL